MVTPLEFESLLRNVKNIFFVAFIQKIQLVRVGFFHLCRKAQHRLRWFALRTLHTQHHLTDRSTSLPRAAQMNEVESLPQMMLQQIANDVTHYGVNDVALLDKKQDLHLIFRLKNAIIPPS